MLRDAGLRRRVVVGLVMTVLLWMGCSQGAVALRGHGLAPLHRVSSIPHSLPAVRVLLQEGNTLPANSDEGLSRGAVAGIVVGAVLGAAALAALIGLLICCLRRNKTNTSDQQKPGITTPEAKHSSWSVWNFTRRKKVASRGKAAQPPMFGSDKQDPGDISDTSFVLPELGGPNPHNKFDGMEWVDIKGLDDDTLQDISTDLRKYQQRR